MRYSNRNYGTGGRSRTARAKRPGQKGREPVRRDGQGLALLGVQMTLCVVLLAVVFTMQYLEPEQYKTLGSYYAKVMSQNSDTADDETLRLLKTPITVKQLREWWDSWEPEKLASVFARTDKQAAMGGEETVFPRNASYRNVLVSAAARSPLACDAVITSLYGERSHPISGAWDFHTGIDLAAPAGTGIYPIYPGVVTATGYSQSYGNYIKLQNGENLETIYCHCEDILCKTGEKVTVDDKIATVGSTGVSTGPHLHLSVLAEGYYVDPMKLYLP